MVVTEGPAVVEGPAEGRLLNLPLTLSSMVGWGRYSAIRSEEMEVIIAFLLLAGDMG